MTLPVSPYSLGMKGVVMVWGMTHLGRAQDDQESAEERAVADGVISYPNA